MKKLQPLINNQTIKIDNHNRGDGRELSQEGIHIHKRTNTKIDGKRRDIDIEVPLNSTAPKRITSGNKKYKDIPRSLQKEIQEAFEDVNLQEKFVRAILDILAQCKEGLSEEVALDAIRRLSDFFDLGWNVNEVQDRVEGVRGQQLYTMFVKNTPNKRCYSLRLWPKSKEIMICDTMQEEIPKISSNKYIVVVKGTANRGKTTAIKGVANLLKGEFPCTTLEEGADIEVVFNAKGMNIGIESQGDPHSRMVRSMEDFVTRHCSIILAACRTKGDTYNKVYELSKKYGYKIIWASLIGPDNRDLYFERPEWNDWNVHNLTHLMYGLISHCLQTI